MASDPHKRLDVTGSGDQAQSPERAAPTATKARATSRAERSGRVFTWLAGGALAFNVLMIGGLLVLLAWMGMGYFWPKPIHELVLDDGSKIWGEVLDRREKNALAARTAADEKAGADAIRYELNIKRGNRKIYGQSNDFRWVDENRIRERSVPEDIVHLERLENGNFHGRLVKLRVDGKKLEVDRGRLYDELQRLIDEKAELRDEIHAIETGPIDDINYELDQLRLAKRGVELEGLAKAEETRRIAELETQRQRWIVESERYATQMIAMRQRLEDSIAVFEIAEGTQHEIEIGAIVRAIRPNAMGVASKLGLYVTRIWEFVSDNPRESNTEGGIFPAIFGTVLMVFLMTFAVTPLGVLAALYLREYAKEGFLVRLVRIAVNNLAGVPSIVFGIFGLGFFVYLCGGTLDQLFFAERLPKATFGTGGILWGALTLALLTVPVVIVATEEGLAAVPKIVRQGSQALGATKFETTWKVVLPAAGPGILTGIILAIARAAGEVAPLMIVGMVKLAPAMPVDGRFPFVHLDRKFMHLGFHIYDVGFQSPNVEATKPLVYATALLLVVLVTIMNLVAISIRNHLRRKYATSAV